MSCRAFQIMNLSLCGAVSHTLPTCRQSCGSTPDSQLSAELNDRVSSSERCIEETVSEKQTCRGVAAPLPAARCDTQLAFRISSLSQRHRAAGLQQNICSSGQPSSVGLGRSHERRCRRCLCRGCEAAPGTRSEILQIVGTSKKWPVPPGAYNFRSRP